MMGTQVSHYRVISELGRGGMGVVYLAEDTILNRKVALKFLKPDAFLSPDAESRLLREARAASALDHPGIGTIYEIGEWEGHRFIAMAYYDGQTLAARMARGPFSIDHAVALIVRLAGALARAHAADIVHRDLKPANIMLTADGSPRILDFGLATHESLDGATITRLTATGTTVGTAAYMSPEQARGEHVDHRADVWALGVIAFEMLAGRLPFTGAHQAGILHSIIYEPRPDLRSLRAEVPKRLQGIVATALEKDLAARYSSAEAFAAALEAWQTDVRTESSPSGRLASLRNPLIAVPLAIVLVALVALSIRTITQVRTERWAREEAIPEIARLIDAEQFAAAFALGERAERAVPGDPTLARLWPLMLRTPSIKTEPSGATVSYKSYAEPDADWRVVGVTPIEAARVPAGAYRWRFERAGFEPVEVARLSGPPPPGAPPALIEVPLVATGSGAAGMVSIPGSREPYLLFLPGFEHLPPVRLPDAFLMDRTEVTNEDFKKFVDAGGYQKREYWQEPFLDRGTAMSWQDAVARFRDATGRPGPATWAEGEYAAGQGRFPVSGVSWYEAAAFARFAGKQLPTIYHWTKTAEPRSSLWVVPPSNFGGTGAASVASRRAVHFWGTHDMAGNLKEWVWNDSGDGRRYILGGGWDDPPYMFNEPDARSPFDRAPTFGFRCVRYDAPPGGNLLATVVWPTRDYAKEKPASDSEFRIYRRLYAYDRSPVRAEPAKVDDSDENWRREEVVFPAPYGNEQMRLFVYLPKKHAPPFHTVLLFPGANFLRTRSFELLPIRLFDYILKSGRAVAFPVLKGTFDRPTEVTDSTANSTVLYRDHVIAWAKDVSRSVDYLETRPDLSLGTLAFIGNSWGARMGSIIPALDERFKLAVLFLGGFSMQQAQPEVDQINFASRVTIPVLMLNGRYDFFFPVDASQKPMFETFGTPPEHKRHLLFEGGHNLPRLDMIRETLNWLDQYQGPPAGRQPPTP